MWDTRLKDLLGLHYSRTILARPILLGSMRGGTQRETDTSCSNNRRERDKKPQPTGSIAALRARPTSIRLHFSLCASNEPANVSLPFSGFLDIPHAIVAAAAALCLLTVRYTDELAIRMKSIFNIVSFQGRLIKIAYGAIKR